MLDCILDTAENFRGCDVTGHAHDEQVAETLVEDKLRWDARIGAAEDGGEWVLSRNDLDTSCRRLVRMNRLARDEASIAIHQILKGLIGTDGGMLGGGKEGRDSQKGQKRSLHVSMTGNCNARVQPCSPV
jgi:hypothetical protein